ncbi:MAG: sugar phosphate isomerase/epimerase [Calditrichaeota bacterium]|nr:sugar phosphate isomerase/epimerase [Calditrichota bacterium]
MNTPLHHHIKPGLVHFMAFPEVIKGHGEVKESLQRVLADEYFEVVEITWIKNPAMREEVREMLITSGVEVKYGAQPRLLTQGLDLNSEDEAHRQRAIDDIRDAIDDAVGMGIRDIGILSGKYPGEAQKAKAMDRLQESLYDLCAYASLEIANIVLEVFDQIIDKKCLIGTAADAREIAERICRRYNNFGLLVDLSHIPLLNESPAQALRPVQEYICHIHIGNCYMKNLDDPAYGDQHPRFGYPGGANDVPEIVGFLKELFHIGYLKKDGSVRMPVSFEIKPVGEEDPYLVIANAKRKLNEAWALLEV